MTSFLGFALYLCFSALVLVVVPVLMVPGLRVRTRILICALTFFVLVPGGLALYATLGAPPMAAL
jgi:hypothetical protein